MEKLGEKENTVKKDFREYVSDDNTGDIHILQLNIIKRCNLKCTHCHVMSGPERNEMMDRETFDKAIEVYKKLGFDTIDITGGEPTLHPDIEYFIKKASEVSDNVILRSNLVGLAGRRSFIELLKEKGVTVVASLPCYTAENTDAMRGAGTFDKIIDSIKVLNGYGYGKELPLTLVYNPLGAFLPGDQKELEEDYRRELGEMGAEFTDLITITNLPVGCFKDELKSDGGEESYMNLLRDNFNEDTVGGLMCRYQVSVGYDGKVYDCDFNQMEGLTCPSYENLDGLLLKEDTERKIIFRDYCFGCTAGAGSSCGGALVE